MIASHVRAASKSTLIGNTLLGVVDVAHRLLRHQFSPGRPRRIADSDDDEGRRGRQQSDNEAARGSRSVMWQQLALRCHLCCAASVSEVGEAVVRRVCGKLPTAWRGTSLRACKAVALLHKVQILTVERVQVVPREGAPLVSGP